jgi:hypothetical protein
MARPTGLAADRNAMVGKSDCSQQNFGPRMNRIISALKTIPPTPRWRPARPMQARSDTLSCHSLSSESKRRHDRLCDPFGREPYLHQMEARADVDLGHAACRRVRACRIIKVENHSFHGPAQYLPETSVQLPKRFGRRLACDAQAMRGEEAPCVRGRPIRKVRLKKPAASFPARAFEILAMVNICR